MPDTTSPLHPPSFIFITLWDRVLLTLFIVGENPWQEMEITGPRPQSKKKKKKNGAWERVQWTFRPTRSKVQCQSCCFFFFFHLQSAKFQTYWNFQEYTLHLDSNITLSMCFICAYMCLHDTYIIWMVVIHILSVQICMCVTHMCHMGGWHTYFFLK